MSRRGGVEPQLLEVVTFLKNVFFSKMTTSKTYGSARLWARIIKFCMVDGPAYNVVVKLARIKIIFSSQNISVGSLMKTFILKNKWHPNTYACAMKSVVLLW